jgi:hypothetical protein
VHNMTWLEGSVFFGFIGLILILLFAGQIQM